MLETMRRWAQGIVVKVLLGCLAGLFVLWGVGDMFRGKTHNTVATVENIEISATQFSNLLRRELGRYQQMLGRALTEDEMQQLNIRRMVVDQLVNSQLIRLRTQDMHIRVSSDMVKKDIIKNDVFADESGKFNRDTFLTVLKSNGLSEETYVKSQKENAAVQLLLDTLATAPESVAVQSKALFNYRFESRMADVIAVPKDYVKDVAEPTDADLVQFYQENPKMFSIPELREVSYVTFGVDSVRKNLQISEEELQKEYETNKDQYLIPEQRNVDQYLFESEEDAKKAYALLTEKKSVPGNKKVALGPVSREDLLKEVREQIFTMTKGGITEPVKSSLGWHVFIVNDILPEHTKSFEEVRSALVNDLMDIRTSEELEKFATQIEDAINAGMSLDDIAKKYELITHKAGGIDSYGKGASGKAVGDLPDPNSFLPLVFQLDANTLSPLTLLPDNATYVVARVDAIAPERVRALDEVKGNAVTLWKERQKINKLNETATAISKSINEGKPMDEVAKTYKLAVQKGKEMLREPADPQKSEKAAEPAALVQELFTLAVGKGTAAYQAADGSFRVAVLTAVKPADEKTHASELADIENSLKESFANDILAQYNSYLAKHYKVTINQEALSAAAN